MSNDPTGTPHTGTYGLFDDPDELASAIAHATSHELHRLKGRIRRLERHDQASACKAQHREEKRALRLAQGKAAEGWFDRVLCRRLRSEGNRDEGYRENGGGGNNGRGEARRRVEYRIVRRPTTPEVLWRKEDVQIGDDSIWLQECGMVRVKSENPGGCHIVSKSAIGKGE